MKANVGMLIETIREEAYMKALKEMKEVLNKQMVLVEQFEQSVWAKDIKKEVLIKTNLELTRLIDLSDERYNTLESIS